MQAISGAPVVLMHESVTGKIARIQTYADAVTRERDQLVQAAAEYVALTASAQVPFIDLTEMVRTVAA
jgi:hypothetical protein